MTGYVSCENIRYTFTNVHYFLPARMSCFAQLRYDHAPKRANGEAKLLLFWQQRLKPAWVALLLLMGQPATSRLPLAA